MKQQQELITVDELIKQLSMFDKNMKIDFSGLDFYRLKNRGSNILQVEFNQVVFRDDEGNVIVDNV